MRPVTQWKLSNTGVLDFVMLLHAADQSSVFKICGPNENRPTEGWSSLGPRAGHGWVEAEKSNFDWTSHFPERLAGPSVGLFSLGPQTLNTLD